MQLNADKNTSPIDVVGVVVVVVVVGVVIVGVVVGVVVVVVAVVVVGVVIVVDVVVVGIVVSSFVVVGVVVVVGGNVVGVVVSVSDGTVVVSTDALFMKHTDELLSSTYGFVDDDSVASVQRPSCPCPTFLSNKMVPQSVVTKQ